MFEPLDEQEAARAEALILDELAGKTYPQVERLAWRAALAVAPDVAERRRTAAERQARVTVFREDSGTVGLSGRDLPAAEALAGHANVVARARHYQASGAFPGRRTAAWRQSPTSTCSTGSAPANGSRSPPARARNRPPAPDRTTSTATATETNGPGGTAGGPRPDGPAAPAPEPTAAPGPSGTARTSRATTMAARTSLADRKTPGRRPPLAEVTVPLATLQGLAERAGDNRLLGPLDPALARDLAAAAARSPWSRWELTIVDQHGYATGHGIARPARGASPPPPLQPQPPPGQACPRCPPGSTSPSPRRSCTS